MKIKAYIGLGFALALSCVFARAELVWTRDAGWQVKGGVLANVMGENVNVSNALEAMNEGKAAFDNESYRSAIGYYSIVIERYPESLFAPEALMQISKAYTENGQFERAFNSLQEIVKRYPEYPNFNQVVGHGFKIASMIQGGATPYLWGWIPWFTDYNDAIKFYEKIVENAPFSDYAPIALMNISLVAEDLEKYEVAFDALDRLINTYPNSFLTSDAYLQMANVYRKLVAGPEYDQGPTRNAISFFQDYLILFPEESQVAHAEEGLESMRDTLARSRLLLGDFYYYYRNNHVAASIFYNETVTIAPETPAAEEAKKQLKKIADGVLAPMTPYDWFWGRYENPSISQYEYSAELEELNNEKFKSMSAEEFSKTAPKQTESASDESYEKLAPVYGPELDDYLFEDGFHRDDRK